MNRRVRRLKISVCNLGGRFTSPRRGKKATFCYPGAQKLEKDLFRQNCLLHSARKMREGRGFANPGFEKYWHSSGLQTFSREVGRQRFRLKPEEAGLSAFERISAGGFRFDSVSREPTAILAAQGFFPRSADPQFRSDRVLSYQIALSSVYGIRVEYGRRSSLEASAGTTFLPEAKAFLRIRPQGPPRISVFIRRTGPFPPTDGPGPSSFV